MSNKVFRIGYAEEDVRCASSQIRTAQDLDRCLWSPQNIETPMISYIVKMLNITSNYVLIEYPFFAGGSENRTGGFITPDENITSIMGGLISGDIDFYPWELAITESRFQTIGLTFPIYYDQLCIFQKRSSIMSNVFDSRFYFEPFTPTVWVVFATLAFIYLTYYYTLELTYLPATFRLHLRHHLQLPFRFTLLLFVCYYNANIQSFFVQPREPKLAFSNFAQLATLIKANKLKLTIETDTDFRFDLISKSALEDFRLLNAALEVNGPLLTSNFTECQRLLTESDYYVYISTELTGIYRFSSNLKSEFQVVCPRSAPALPVGYGLRKHSPYIETFSRYAPWLHAQVYLRSRWRRTFLSQFSTNFADQQVTRIPAKVLGLLFAVLGVGYFSAFVVLLIENLKRCIRFRKILRIQPIPV